MEFKKTDKVELERTITIVLCLLMIVAVVVNFLQQTDFIRSKYIERGGIVIPIGALILIMFDVMMLMQVKPKKLNVFMIIVLLSFASIIISTVAAQDMTVALSGNPLHSEGTFVWLAYIVIMLNAYLIKNKKNRKIVYFSLTAIAVFEVALGVCQVIIKPDFLKNTLSNLYFGEGRAFGTMENPNPYGSLIVLFMGIESILIYTAKNNKKRCIHCVLMLLYATVLFLSGTRGAIVGYGAAALIFSIALIVNSIKNKKNIGKTFAVLGAVIACIVVGFLVTNVSSKSTVEYIEQRIEYDTTTENTDTIGTSRILIWKESINTFLEHPVIGAGISNLYMEVPVADYNLINYDAHNRYLQVLSTQGIIGILIYLALIVYVVITAIKRIRKYGFDYENGLYMGLLMAFTAYMVADLFCIGVYALAPFIYLVMGLLVAKEDGE